MSSASQAKINALVRLRSETLAAIVLGITNNVNRLLLLALDQLMVDNRFRGDIDGMMPYLYAAGFLALSGQDLTSKKLKDALEVVGRQGQAATDAAWAEAQYLCSLGQEKAENQGKSHFHQGLNGLFHW